MGEPPAGGGPLQLVVELADHVDHPRLTAELGALADERAGRGRVAVDGDDGGSVDLHQVLDRFHQGRHRLADGGMPLAEDAQGGDLPDAVGQEGRHHLVPVGLAAALVVEADRLLDLELVDGI